MKNADRAQVHVCDELAVVRRADPGGDRARKYVARGARRPRRISPVVVIKYLASQVDAWPGRLVLEVLQGSGSNCLLRKAIFDARRASSPPG